MPGLLVEPPRADLHARRSHVRLTPFRAGLATGAAIMAGAASGDMLLLGVMLGAIAGHVASAAAVALASVSVLLRWGSSSLEALAGNQAVIGAAGWTGSLPAAASAWCAAVAILAATPPGVLPAAAFGLAAAGVAVGPGLGGPVLVRVAGLVVGVVLAYGIGRVIPARVGRGVALIAGLLSVGLAGIP